jgi:SAM-dependent methyltransferase
MFLINIGCGAVFHPAWINIDVNPCDPSVRCWDVQRGLPLKNGEAEVCYASHVLEHLTPAAGGQLLAECHRVLRPGGIIRLVVPDLETIARHYLQLLERAERGEPGAEADYEWIMLELYDQTVRASPGGEMLRYLSGPDVPNRSFVESRIGLEAQVSGQHLNMTQPQRFIKRVKSLSARQMRDRLSRTLIEAAARLVGGTGLRNAFREGMFRSSGEVHRWMYDRYSLKKLLQNLTFAEIKVCTASESRIVDFNTYQLDTVGGKVRKPDSLFMEAVKL